MKVKISVRLSCAFETAVSAVKKSSLLHFVASPLVSFSPAAGAFPQTWTPGTHWAGLKLFGFIPFGKQAIVISFEPVSSKFVMHDRGHSALIRKWHHTITIEPIGAGESQYTDEVEIQAGLLTPVIWGFASVFYRHRQKRWLELCAQNFRQLT